MSERTAASRPGPLRLVVLAVTGQDVRKCQHCDWCSALLSPDHDVSVQSLLQMVALNDEEALTCRTLWSDVVLASARNACANGIDVEAVLLALRAEARRRGISHLEV